MNSLDHQNQYSSTIHTFRRTLYPNENVIDTMLRQSMANMSIDDSGKDPINVHRTMSKEITMVSNYIRRSPYRRL